MSLELVHDTLDQRPEWAPLDLTPVASHTQYANVADYLKTIKAFQRRVTDFFKPHKDRALAAHRALVEDERKALEPALVDELTCKRLMLAWDSEQERVRRAEEQRRQEEARQEEEARRVAEAAALESEALATGDSALLDQAMELIEMPAPSPVIAPVEKQTPKVVGVSYRETWSARVVSLPALIKFVATHPEHINLLQPNLPALNQMARAMRGALKVDGVQAVSERTVAASTR